MGNKIGKYDVIDNLLVVIFIAILAIGCNTCNSIQSKERIESELPTTLKGRGFRSQYSY